MENINFSALGSAFMGANSTIQIIVLIALIIGFIAIWKFRYIIFTVLGGGILIGLINYAKKDSKAGDK